MRTIPPPLIRDSKSHLKRQWERPVASLSPHKTCGHATGLAAHRHTPQTVNRLDFSPDSLNATNRTALIRQRARTKFVLFQVPRETHVGENPRLNHQNLRKDRDIKRVHDKSWSNKNATLIIGILTDSMTVLKVPGSVRSSFW